MTVDELKERAHILKSPEDVDLFLRDHKDGVLFKAGTCHRTDDAFVKLSAALADRDDLAIGLVRVVEARAASQRLAQITGVRHESPQILLIKQGRVVFARDNWAISQEALTQALDANFGPPSTHDK
jgi:bacillithiol system protein YtxJ